MNKYQPYNLQELDTILNEPWEVSDRPYLLHAAFALYSLYETLAPDSDDEDELPIENMWGMTVPKTMLDRLVDDIATDFNDAASNRKQVRIWNRSYSIRKVNAYDRSALRNIFSFPLKNGEYTITKEGIMDLRGEVPEAIKDYEVTRQEFRKNKSYFRKVVKLAEDDQSDGWDKLTDMEVIIYCWGQFYSRFQDDNLALFKQEYKDYIYVSDNDMMGCMNAKSILRNRPDGMYPFSQDKVAQWNERNHQKSHVHKIVENEAEDYWYEVAIKRTFIPKDFR